MSAGWVALVIMGTVAVISVSSPTLRSYSERSEATTSPTPAASVPAVILLLSESGSGDQALPVFATTGRWQIQYGFDCGNLGRPGSFQLLEQPPAYRTVLINQLGRSASNILFADTGPGQHSLLVRSACGWVVTISEVPSS